MKRTDALTKVYKICQRLDAVNPQEFFVIPVRLYLFGSLLTNKPNPADIDFLFDYREQPDLNVNDVIYALKYGKPSPSHLVSPQGNADDSLRTSRQREFIGALATRSWI